MTNPMHSRQGEKKPYRKPLTLKQQFVFKWLYSCFGANQYSPTLQELTEFLKEQGLSSAENTSMAQYYVDVLVKKGWMIREKGLARGYYPATLMLAS